MVNHNPCFYPFIHDKLNENDTHIFQYFVMDGLRTFIKLKSDVTHMSHEWSFIHNTYVPVALNGGKLYPSLDSYGTFFPAVTEIQYNTNHRCISWWKHLSIIITYRILQNIFIALLMIINISWDKYLKLKFFSSSFLIYYIIILLWTKKYCWLYINVFN